MKNLKLVVYYSAFAFIGLKWNEFHRPYFLVFFYPNLSIFQY